MKKILIIAIEGYRAIISPMLVTLFGPGCKFNPTCSSYAVDSISKHGSLRGTLLATKRLAKCHSFSLKRV